MSFTTKLNKKITNIELLNSIIGGGKGKPSSSSSSEHNPSSSEHKVKKSKKHKSEPEIEPEKKVDILKIILKTELDKDKEKLNSEYKNKYEVYDILLSKLNILHLMTSHKNKNNYGTIKSDFSNSTIYRTAHIGSVDGSNIPIPLTLKTPPYIEYEPIYFTSSENFARLYCNSYSKRQTKIYKYDIFTENPTDTYNLFIEISSIDENNRSFNLLNKPIINMLYNYCISKYKLSQNGKEIQVPLTLYKNNSCSNIECMCNFGLSSTLKNVGIEQFKSAFGCSNQEQLQGKRCSTYELDKFVTVPFHKLFTEFEIYCNKKLQDIGNNSRIRILGYYAGMIEAPMSKEFHTELTIQAKYMNPFVISNVGQYNC